MAREKDYFNTFCTVSRAFGTAATREELLDLIVQSAIDTMNGKAACLFLADGKQDMFIPTAQKGLSKNYLHANPIKARKKIASLVKEGYQAYADATGDPRLENHTAKIDEGIASILTVPVMVHDSTIGVLSLYTSTNRDFNEVEIRFLRSLAEQGGMAIERARLMDRINKNIALFLELAAAINSTLDIKKVLEYLTVQVCDALGMKGAVIRLLDQDTDTLKLVASHGLSNEFLDKGFFQNTESTLRELRGDTVAVPDLVKDKELKLPKEIFRKENVGAMLIVPIQAKNQVIGTLHLYSKTPRKFPQDIIALVQALGHQGGLAIQNATLFLTLQEDKKDLENEIWTHRSWF